MRLVVQRVERSSVTVKGETVGDIGAGLCVLVGYEQSDSDAVNAWAVDKLINLRVFEDGDGKMNRSLLDVGGGILAVPNFTLAGDASKGRRPSFTSSMEPRRASGLFDALVASLSERVERVAAGRFGAEMRVQIANDGPVTLVIDSPARLSIGDESG
jgi:D-tyrosyl-tRNA(Tyr) deacylase